MQKSKHLLLNIFLWSFLLYTPLAYAAQVSQAEFTTFTEAKKLLDAKKYSAAATVLAKYFQQGGRKHSYGYDLYSAVLLATKQYSTAIKILEAGTKTYPNNASLLQKLGMAYYHSGQKTQAAQIFQRAYGAADKNKPELAYMAAHFFVDAKQYKLAIGLLKPIIALKSAKPVWYQVLAQAYVGAGDAHNAAITIEQGLARFGNSAQMWRLLAYMYYKQRKLDKAAAAYEVAYALKPASANELQQLAFLYYSIYAPYSGKRLQKTDALSPQVLDAMSFSFAQIGDLNTAAEAAQKAVQKAPSAERQFRLASILRRKKDTSAPQMFRALAKQGGKYGERAQWALIEIAWEQGQWKSLHQKLQSLLASNGEFAGRAEQLLPIIEQIINKELTSYAQNSDKEKP